MKFQISSKIDLNLILNQVVGGAHKSDTAVSEASKKMRALLRNNTAFGHWIPPADGDDAKLHLNTEVDEKFDERNFRVL